jgi:hypothetical protein
VDLLSAILAGARDKIDDVSRPRSAERGFPHVVQSAVEFHNEVNARKDRVDQQMLPRTRKWVESWERVKSTPEDELKDYLVKKCRNGYQMAKKPARNQRDAWVTLLAEEDEQRKGLSPLAMRMVEHVRRTLSNEGYDFEINLDDTGGASYAEVHFRTLTRKPGSAA